MKLLALLSIVICLGISIKQLYLNLKHSKKLNKRIKLEIDPFYKQVLTNEYQRSISISVLFSFIIIVLLLVFLFIVL